MEMNKKFIGERKLVVDKGFKYDINYGKLIGL